MMKTLASITAWLTLASLPCHATLFEGSYTLGTGEVIAFTADGTIQNDNDTVLFNSFVGTPTFDGLAPVATNPQFFRNIASLSGATLDLSWFADGGVGFQMTSEFQLFASGPGYGNTQESLNSSFTLTQAEVPEPTSLALLSLGGLLVTRRRR